MHIDCRRNAVFKTGIGLTVAAWFSLLAGCAPVIGYPNDPENTDQTLANLQPYFNGVKEADYLATAPSDAVLRKQLRDAIIFARMRAYDIEFADFERRLYGDGNGVTLGSDLVGLVLAGLTATTGNATTKSALGAASAGVIGAKSAIDKDLYYQKTIPALLAQMEADRLKALEPITEGMKQSDADYPLMQAYIDLDTYKIAGSVPGAINAVNQSAANAKDKAIEALRTTRFMEDTYSDRLSAYIWPSGITNPASQTNVNKLRQWMSSHSLAGVPIETLLHSSALSDQRKQAVSDLSVP
jgi:hypothetical protein